MAKNLTVHKLPDADGSSLKLLTDSGTFARDENHVFFFGVALEGADPATFQVLERHFGKDSQSTSCRDDPDHDKSSRATPWEPLQRGLAEDPWYRGGRICTPGFAAI